jgi:hypothetical protein
VNVGIYGTPKRQEEMLGGDKGMAEKLRTLEEHCRNVQGWVKRIYVNIINRVRRNPWGQIFGENLEASLGHISRVQRK